MAKDTSRELENVQREELEKRPWRRMEMVHLGNAADLIQGGGGKLSLSGGDPGEHRKQSGGGG